MQAARDCLELLNSHEKTGEIPQDIQKQALRILQTQFLDNMGSRNKKELQGEELEAYLEVCRSCLERIPDNLIRTDEPADDKERLPYALWSAFMALKYQEKCSGFSIKQGRLACADSQIGLEPMVLIELIECVPACREADAGMQQRRAASNKEKHNGDSRQKCRNGADDRALHIDGGIERFQLGGRFRFAVELDGKEIRYESSRRFSKRDFFGKTITDRMSFSVEIPIRALSHGSTLRFLLKDKGESLALQAAAPDYQARLTTMLKQAYWCFDGFMMTFQRNEKKQPTAYLFQKAGSLRRIRQEVRLLAEIAAAPYGSRRMALVRMAYWLAYPVCRRKNIWITFDKLYKGGDCGEYFYRYMKDCGKDIMPVYVLRRDTADWKRMTQEGYAPSAYGSLGQRLQYLYASVVFATHSSVHAFCGFSKWEIRFVQDLLRCVNTCIQHGLSVQDLAFDSNRVINNNKRYYCASKYEIQNLSKPEYDYAPGTLRLTGIPRYDGLKGREQKQILITPTWRSYIAMPAVMGKMRPYNPQFQETDYYKIFQELLEDEKLSACAKQNGYRILYLLHPVISAQKKDFHPADGIEIVSAAEVNYEQVLTQSSLMVTDYSGVQFDFAYMRKPVVYFHPPKLPPHYEEGGFCYETQGFGEICRAGRELADLLCAYMETGCSLKECYRQREDVFFAFDDHENCRRIYEDARAGFF